jgi:Mannosyl-glycoprotein endo-beta-N-acetylglucosaminidase/LysM domain
MKRLILFSGLLFTVFLAKADYNKFSTQDYVEIWKITAIEQMNEYQIPASITLAQGILESGNGNSRLARSGNNHFGIKCHKNWDGERIYEDDDLRNECFRSYSNAAQSYQDHSLFLSGRSRYEDLFQLSLTDYKGWSKGLKSAGYATNPKYAHLLIDIIEKFDLAKYDRMPYLPSQEKGDLTIKMDEPITDISESADAEKYGIEDEDLVQLEVKTASHDIKVNHYRTRYVRVHKGDTYYRIAQEFDLGLWQLYRYNELGKRDVLKEGEIIYLDPKKNRARRGNNIFICESPMTLRHVAQYEGIKLKKLLKYNFGTEADTTLPIGTKVILR